MLSYSHHALQIQYQLGELHACKYVHDRSRQAAYVLRHWKNMHILKWVRKVVGGDGDEHCLYDTKAMGSLEMGEATKHAQRYYKFLDEAMEPGN